jgi:hypothetical protein
MTQHVFSPSVGRIAGQVATVGLLLAIVAQILLALGILPITMAWGSSQSVLTMQLRLASLLAAVILGGFIYVIRRRAGLLGSGRPSKPIKILAWVITLYLALNTLGNVASSSTGEVTLFGSLSLVSALACLLVSAARIDL